MSLSHAEYTEMLALHRQSLNGPGVTPDEQHRYEFLHLMLCAKTLKKRVNHGGVMPQHQAAYPEVT